MDKRAPIFYSLIKHSKKKAVSFHVPGHKMGKGFNPLGKKVFKEIMNIDMTEITGLDDLHQPEDIILESQKNAARIFRSDHTFYLINGSTSGNLAMILATCKPGDKIIVQRNVHKSVINGLFLAKAEPIYIFPEIITSLEIPGSIQISDLENLLKKHGDIKAVFIMNPNYYGIGIDISEMADLVHKYRIPLLVDEAHGAHFGFHPQFPKSSIDMGADVVVQSTHKTLSAMTMGSMLHVNSNLIDIDRIKLFLAIVQSSSPSYPIMASLELTSNWIENEGKNLWKKQLLAINWLYERTRSLKNICIIEKINDNHYKDPLKVIIQSKTTKLTGFEIQHLLEEDGIFTELADFNNVLAIISFGNKFKDIARLKKSLIKIDSKLSKLLVANGKVENSPLKMDKYYINNKGSVVTLEKVLYSQYKSRPLYASIGEISYEMVIPYPPGVPIISYGEEITKEAVDYLIELKNKGVKFQGVKDKSLKYIRVLERDI